MQGGASVRQIAKRGHVKFSPDVKPASRSNLTRAYAANFVRSIGRLAFKNVKRTNDVVDSEYNSGGWDRVLNERAWLAGTLEEFLIGKDEAPRLAKVDNQIVRIATADYYRYRIGALSGLMARHAGEVKSLVELGAGFGYNLFSLSLDRRWTRLHGFDIAQNGIEAGRQIVTHFQLADRIGFGRIDLTDAHDKHFQEVEGSTVFTFFCIEQIPYSVEAVVENVLRARPARVINIEPGIDMLDLLQPRDLSSWLYLKSMDYQTRLFSYLDEIEKAGRIRVLARERMQFASTMYNDGNLRVWEPV
jgi:hypothetical protein